MLVGYALVSTIDQNLHVQTDSLQAGCEGVFTDTVSGAWEERSGLAVALQQGTGVASERFVKSSGSRAILIASTVYGGLAPATATT